jgi:hypothetical protein
MGGPELIHRHAAVARRLLECPHLLDGALAQVAWIGLAQGVPQTTQELQQGGGGLDQR